MTLKGSFHTISQNLLTTSGLSILVHGVISLPDAMSYDKYNILPSKNIFMQYKSSKGAEQIICKFESKKCLYFTAF